jgi:hypothetical protein
LGAGFGSMDNEKNKDISRELNTICLMDIIHEYGRK